MPTSLKEGDPFPQRMCDWDRRWLLGQKGEDGKELQRCTNGNCTYYHLDEHIKAYRDYHAAKKAAEAAEKPKSLGKPPKRIQGKPAQRVQLNPKPQVQKMPPNPYDDDGEGPEEVE